MTRRDVNKRMWVLIRKMFNEREDSLARKAALSAKIASCAVGGEIAVIESGMDCDGVRYSGCSTVIPATVSHFNRHLEKRSYWADGPFHLDIARPDVEVEYESEDLALRAFEDGHSHVIYG